MTHSHSIRQHYRQPSKSCAFLFKIDTHIEFPCSLSHNARPRDPFIINPRHSTRIEVSTYGRPLAELDVLQCILPATEQQVAEIESSYPQDPPIGDNLRFRSDNVTLTLLPTLRMRWSIWGVTLRGLTKFFYQNEYMELTFLVKENGFMVGIGRFKLQPRTATG